MAAEVSLSPFELLQAIERRCRQQAVGLPAQDEAREEWTGVLFSLRGQPLLAPMAEVAEIVSLPEVARVPGVKPWVLGIANMRGNLLPVMDLQCYLYGEPSKADAKTRRLLVLNHGGIYAGLLVDAVYGMKHLYVDEMAEEPPALNAAIASYVSGSFARLGEEFVVFSLHRLAQSEAFLNVAA